MGPWRRLRKALTRGLAVLGVAVFFLVLLAAGAGWYTSRPEFCRSCHIMEPYYKSWEASKHSHVPCIDCHFAPGFGGKVRGKMLGLVQLAKYVTSSEGPRPAAEIPDESCLRSGCHEKRLLEGLVDFHGVPFDHAPHLPPGEEGLRHGKKLRCTSCHSQIVQGSHMTVTTNTCFLCHFKEGRFNEGLGTCTRCHAIPKKEFDLGGGAMFTHDLAYRPGVKCEYCHADVIRGKGEVPRDRCAFCHNREDHLQQIDDHEFMHRKHVTDHKIDCLACHLEIQHSPDRQKIEHAASDCQSCHPDHHREQVNMLRGIGGKSVPDEKTGMLAVRVECRTCHRSERASRTGALVRKASAESCASCHDRSTAQDLESYLEETPKFLADVEASLVRAREALKAGKAPADRAATIASQLDGVQHDLAFLRAANGVHNVHYASTLTSAVLRDLSGLCRDLGVAGPKVKLPLPVEPKKLHGAVPPAKK